MNDIPSTPLKNLTSGKSIFLSVLIASFLLQPAIALFIGLASAMNNWRKLNMRKEILPYLVAGLIIGLSTNWIENGHIRYGIGVYTIIFLVGIVIVNSFAFHLWKQMDRDVLSLQTTQSALEEPVQGKWATYFFTMLVALFLVVIGSNSIFRLFGYCWPPTLPDILNRISDDNREGVGKLVMRVDDYACGVNFSHQRTGVPDMLFTSPTTKDSYSRTIIFRYLNKEQFTLQNSDIDHYVWVETNPQEFEKIEQIPDRYDDFSEKFLELPVAQLTSEPDLMRVTCSGYDGDEDIYCSVIIVRGDIISVLNFDSANLPPDEFWRIFNSVIVSTDKRIQEYQSQ